MEENLSQYQSWHLDSATGVYTPLPDYNAASNKMGQPVAATNGDFEAPETIGIFLSCPGKNPLPLPPLTGDDVSVATDINNAGVIVGYSRASGTNHWTDVVWRPRINSDGKLLIDGPFLLLPIVPPAPIVEPSNFASVAEIYPPLAKLAAKVEAAVPPTGWKF